MSCVGHSSDGNIRLNTNMILGLKNSDILAFINFASTIEELQSMLFNRSRRLFSLLCVLSLLCMLSFGTLLAMHSPVSAQIPPASPSPQLEVDTDATDEYWTPERLQNAKPLPMPVPNSPLPSSRSQIVPSTPSKTPNSVSVNGQPPTVNIDPDWENRLFTPDKPVDSTNQEQIKPLNLGTTRAYFTSSQLIPKTANVEYPYATVGKLFFTQPGIGDFLCSGAVIRSRIVLTAGHCVHNGNGNSSGFFTNFKFVPAYLNGSAPYGRWNTTYVSTTLDWFNGGGKFPNAADYAMFEMADNIVNGTLRKIGDVVGFLGYSTQNLIPNHATILGYPGNLDSGEQMHQVTAGSFQTKEPNSAIYGSDMGEGSSGGPWIQNFGIRASGQTGGLDSGSNQVIGITSYGPVPSDPLYEGSSIPDSRFTDLYNTICSHRNGNC